MLLSGVQLRSFILLGTVVFRWRRTRAKGVMTQMFVLAEGCVPIGRK